MNASENYVGVLSEYLFVPSRKFISDKISSESDLRVNQTDISINPEWEVLNREFLGIILIMQSIRKDTCA